MLVVSFPSATREILSQVSCKEHVYHILPLKVWPREAGNILQVRTVVVYEYTPQNTLLSNACSGICRTKTPDSCESYEVLRSYGAFRGRCHVLRVRALLIPITSVLTGSGTRLRRRPRYTTGFLT